MFVIDQRHNKSLKYKTRKTAQKIKTYRVPRRVRVPGALVPPAGLQVRSYPFPGSLGEFRKLPRTRVDDGLYLFLRLLADGHHPVQVFVHEQPDEHLKGTNWPTVVRSGADCKGSFFLTLNALSRSGSWVCASILSSLSSSSSSSSSLFPLELVSSCAELASAFIGLCKPN